MCCTEQGGATWAMGGYLEPGRRGLCAITGDNRSLKVKQYSHSRVKLVGWTSLPSKAPIFHNIAISWGSHIIKPLSFHMKWRRGMHEHIIVKPSLLSIAWVRHIECHSTLYSVRHMHICVNICQIHPMIILYSRLWCVWRMHWSTLFKMPN